MNIMKKIILIPAIAGLLFTASANANLLSQSTFDNNTNNVASDAWTGLAPGFDLPYNDTDFFRFDGDRISTDPWIGTGINANVGQVITMDSDNVSFGGNKTYASTVTAFYNTGAIGLYDYDIFVKFRFLNASNVELGVFEPTHSNLITANTAGFITLFDDEFTTIAGTEKIDVVFFANQPSVESVDRLSLDALSFTATAVPEPATFSMIAGLLALSSVALRHRASAK
jgi:hypothetical protein